MSLPTIQSIRLATPADIPRLATITISAFHTTQSFHYNQPYYSSHRLTALHSSRHMYKNIMMSSTDTILVVVEDIYNPDEDRFCPDVVTREQGEEELKRGEKVVVGVAMWKLANNSKRIGDFQDTKAVEVQIPPIEASHETDFWHYLQYTRKNDSLINKHFSKALYLSTLAVHPAYYRRGHGAALTQWGLDLAKMDDIEVGLVASELGEKLYRRLGFQGVDRLEIKGDEISPRGICEEVMKWTGKAKELEVEN